jgi:phage terminase Nu1 subunit (DNA packaging protein)
MAENAQSADVLAKLLDITERRVRQLSAEGIIPKVARGRYEMVGAVRGYIRYLRDLSLKGEVGPADYGIERARLVKAKADLAEMEASQMRGELLPAPDVKRAWTDIVALMRARLLVLPDKIAPVVHETTSIAQAKDVIKKAVFEVLTEIATTDVEVIPHIEGNDCTNDDGDERAESRNAAAKPDNKPVGRSK